MISLIRFEPHPDQQMVGMTDYWKLIHLLEVSAYLLKVSSCLFGQNTIANKVQYSQVK